MGVLLLSSFFPHFSSVFRGDYVKNVVDKLFWVLDVRFYGHIWGGCGTEDIKNGSYGIEFFVCDLVADAGNIFSFKNHVFCVAYVKDVTDSIQNLFSPHKTCVSHGPFYLNVSEYIFHFAALILFFEIFWIVYGILSRFCYCTLLNHMRF